MGLQGAAGLVEADITDLKNIFAISVGGLGWICEICR